MEPMQADPEYRQLMKKTQMELHVTMERARDAMNHCSSPTSSGGGKPHVACGDAQGAELLASQMAHSSS